MSSSGSRGPPPGRYGSEYDYNANKPRRKFYSSAARRDYKSPNTPSSTSSTGISRANDVPLGSGNDSHYRSRYPPAGAATGPGSSSLSRSAGRSYGSSSKYYYQGYGSSSAPSKGELWRKRIPSGGSKYETGPKYDKYDFENGSKYDGKYDTKYDGYNDTASPRWKYSSRPGRSSLSNSVSRPFSSKDKGRGSSLSNSGPKRGDTYYPKAFGKPQVDRYSSKSKDETEASKDEVHSPAQNSDEDDDDEEDDEDDDEDEDSKLDDDSKMEEDNEEKEEELEEKHEVTVQAPKEELNMEIDTDLLGTSTLPPKSKDEKEDEKILSSEIPGPTLPQEDKIKLSPSPDRESLPAMFPLGRVESEFELLKEEFKPLKYSTSKPIRDLREYPFYNRNIHRFLDNKSKLVTMLVQQHQQVHKKKLRLWSLYQSAYSTYETTRTKMSQQLKVLHPPDDEAKRELEAINTRVKGLEVTSEVATPSELPPAGRRSRRHGDMVTTEAEFQEILKSLGMQDEEDPMIKAQKVAADIPDLIIDPVKKHEIFMDSNNLITDKVKWAERVKTDFNNTFNETEQELFCEAFCKYPKRFGAISRYMGGLRTPEDCVVHYYTTKKEVNYKFLAAQYKKKSSKKKRPKSRKTSQVKTPVETPTTEVENPLEEPTMDGIASTENGKRKRSSSATPKDKKRKKEPEPERVEEPQHVPQNIPLPNPAIPPHAYQFEDEEKRKGITSYWNVTETNMFPTLLAECGTNWNRIAERISSKTPTMVRNYYQRNALKNEWVQLAQHADAKLGISPEHSGALVERPYEARDPKLEIGSVYVPPYHIPGQAPMPGQGPMPMIPMGYPPMHSMPLPTPMGLVDGRYATSASPPIANSPPTTANLFAGGASRSPPALPALSSAPVLPPHKSSIMNLLNSDSSPARAQTQPQPQPHVQPKESKPVTSVNALLNSPKSPLFKNHTIKTNSINSLLTLDNPDN